ncbi:MAG: PhnD/SsuA/transferrin family substrate-binding protein [Candidatus Rokuibacteriota bacterium]
MLTLASFLADNARPLYDAIARYLVERTGEPAELLAVPWEDRVRLREAGRVDVAFLCGLPYTRQHDGPAPRLELLCAPLMADTRYGGRPVYFTDVVVRADGPLRTFADLRGTTWAYNDPDSFSGYVVPRHHLLTLGETRGFFEDAVPSGSHQCSIRWVAEGKVDASGIDSTVLELEQARCPDLHGVLRVIESMGPYPIPPVAVSRALDPRRAARLRELFLTMHEVAEGRGILTRGLLARFIPVSDADYDPIRATMRAAEAAGFLTLR